MRFPFFLLVLLSAFRLFSQETQKVEEYPPPMIAVDSLYREDQFYVGVTYNLLLNLRKGVSQNKFSSGFTGGFLRDMPVNKSRTVALATGLGVSYNKYFQNVVISKVDEIPQYNLIANGTRYDKNKFDQIFIDVPIEFRWRTSTPQSHKFWRIYAGVKLSYLASGKARYVDDTYNITVADNKDFNKVQVGTYISWGYNTWNFYGYYGVTPLFKNSAKINNQELAMNTLNLGLMFYIL